MEDPAASSEVEHRFLVKSAEEAVRTIRGRLGEHAQVTSVRRVERGGLTGLFRGAQLEVVARVPAPVGAIPGPGFVLRAPEDEHVPATPWDHPQIEASALAAAEAVATQPAVTPPRSGLAVTAGSDSSRVAGLLQRAGINDSLLTRLQSSPAWARIDRLPLPQALTETAALLRREYGALDRPALSPRIAFVGMAGAGSTSALCKHLARCVFSLGQSAAVYRLETDRPNPIDGLAAICELWGVPLLRSEDEMPAAGEGTRLYVDVPGLSGGADREEEANIADQLNKLAVGSRIFILNAAYEPTLLKGLCRRAEHLGCRHLGFTHLDELVHWGKMWEFLFHKDLSTEFYSVGPGLPGDFTEEVLEGTLAKTFS